MATLTPGIPIVLLLALASTADAQEPSSVYAGIIVGVSVLSADVRAVTTTNNAHVGMYKPENGLTVNSFVGVHFWNYFTVQANHVWNENDVTLISSTTMPTPGAFYENRRTSTHHAFVIDGLLYFRGRASRVRPYLGTGLSMIRFTSRSVSASLTGHLPLPAHEISSTHLGLRSHVGIDFWISRGFAVRYSFSETISGNPISPHLMPMGTRGLANFQNLVGAIVRF